MDFKVNCIETPDLFI